LIDINVTVEKMDDKLHFYVNYDNLIIWWDDTNKRGWLNEEVIDRYVQTLNFNKS